MHNPTPARLSIQRVTPEEMCRRFNEGGYWEQVKAGELVQHLLETRLSILLTPEVVPIQSQLLSYRTLDGEEVARVHQFIRPDGTLAASGLPDPKRLVEGGVMYRLEKKSGAA